MEMKVVKFGGSSLADANQFRRVASIVKADPARRYVVASAPGKRFSDDVKVTDMLYNCYEMVRQGKDIGEFIQKKRHYIISHEIRQKLCLDKHETNISIYLRNLLLDLER